MQKAREISAQLSFAGVRWQDPSQGTNGKLGFLNYWNNELMLDLRKLLYF